MRRWLIALAALAYLFHLPARAQEVAGRVLEDSSGNGLPSSELKFRKPGMRELAADLETDRQGRFRAEGLAAGEYTVEISKPNYITTTFKLTLPSAGLQLRLVRYGVIAGQVVDVEGKPLPGQVRIATGRESGSTRIAILTKLPGSEQLTAVRTTIVGEGGKYRVFDLPPGQYSVGLWYANVPAGSGAQMYPDTVHPRVFTISGGEEYPDVNFTVVPGPSFSVSGKIEGPRPKMGFSVALAIPGQPTLPLSHMWTEEDGTFKLEKIPPGTYDILVAGPTGSYGFLGTPVGKDPAFGRGRIQVIGQNLENVTVPVSTGRTLDVVLRGPGDAPPDGCPQAAAVNLTMLEPWWLMGAGSQAQAGFGKPATIRDLPPARYSVNLFGLGNGCYQVTKPVVDLTGAAPGPITVVVDQAGSIRGTLRTGAAKPNEFTVLLLDAEAAPATPALLAFPDDQGRFTFTGLHPGRYRVTAQPQAAAAAPRWVADVTKMMEVEVAGGAPTDLDLPVAALAGGGQ